jgi:glycosyltransferase involved in cell wall biosynthesis
MPKERHPAEVSRNAVGMVAYATYYNDARIKAYVDSLQQHGAEVDLFVVAEPGKPAFESIGGVRIFYQTTHYRGDSTFSYVLSYARFFISTLIRLSLLAFRRRYAAIHVHNMPNVLVFTALVPKLLGARIILDVHDLMPPNYMAKFGVSAGHAIVRALAIEQRLSAWFADHVLCADHAQQQFLEWECAIPPGKLTVILNLPNERLFSVLPRRTESQHLRLVYHGTLARRLGIDIMLRAVAEASAVVPVHFTIYGAGDFLDEAVTLATTLGLNGTVHFNRSFFAVEKIAEMVGSMDVGIIGNRRTLACDQFMLPVKLLEYVYLGIPVIAPRLTIIQRYFDDTMIKFYSPEDHSDLARCIVELHRCSDARECLARNASRFYLQHNWSEQASAYLRLLPTLSR